MTICGPKNHSNALPKKPARQLTRRGPAPLALEPRLMFDGAAMATAVDAVQHDVLHDVVAFPLATERVATAPREIAFVDTRLDNWQSLVSGIRPGVEVILVQANENGIERMLAALQGQHDISAIHVFGHGASGIAEIGSSLLSTDTLTGLKSQLTTIGSSLTAEGDILLYGCNIAQGQAGIDFTTRLSEITGAGVAASTDATGSAARGGNWVLEARTESIGVASALSAAAQAGYDSVLGTPTITQIVRQTPSYDTTNADSVTFRVTFSEAVTNVVGTDFTFAAGSVSGATVQLVTAVVNSNDTQYDIQVGGLAGTTGTLNLDVDTTIASGTSGIKSVATNESLLYSNSIGGNASTDQTYTIDHAISTPVITGLLNSANAQGDTGASSSDFITSTQNLKITGTTDIGNTVQVFKDGHSIGSATVNGSGNWTLDTTATTLTEGTYSLTATAGDQAGNTSTSSPVTLVIDRTAPTIASVTASDIIVTLTYTESTSLDAVNTAAPSAFTVYDNGTAVTGGVTHVLVDATAKTVMLTLANPVGAGSGHVITVSYTDPTPGDDLLAIQDKAGNDAATDTNHVVSNITNVGDAAPVIAGVSGSTWYSKGDAAVAVFSGTPTLSDTDDTYVESATVTITTNKNATDVLSISGSLPTGITASAYNSGTGALTLSGHAVLADYQTALAQIRFANTTGAALDTNRTITVTVSDGQLSSTAATRTMHVLGSAFSLGDTTTAYLVGAAGGTNLYGVNLVMGTISTLVANFTSDTLNGMGFSPVDGHLYASDNTTFKIVRINADGTMTAMSAAYNGTGNVPPAAALNSADVGPDGVIYQYSGTKIYWTVLSSRCDSVGFFDQPQG